MASKSSSPSSVAGAAKSDAENENEKPDTSASAGGSTSDIDDEEDVQEEDESQLYFRAHVLFVGLRYYQGVAHIGGECGVSIYFVTGRLGSTALRPAINQPYQRLGPLAVLRPRCMYVE